MSHEVKTFLAKYGVRHRVSSVGNPHSNQRAEVGIKSMKRLIRGNLGPSGSLDDDSFAQAILQYRNTPLQSTCLSPAVALFGHPIRDFLPLTRKTYTPSIQWTKKIGERELKMSKARTKEHEKWSKNTKNLRPLRVGDEVSIQNLAGNNPLKWDRTGVVVEVLGYDQYYVKVDGTGRITLRNRKHLRKIGFRKPAEPFPDKTVIKSQPQTLVVGEGENRSQNIQSPRPIVTPKARQSLEKSLVVGSPCAQSTPRKNLIAERSQNDTAIDSTMFSTPMKETPEEMVPAAPTLIQESTRVMSPQRLHPELRSHMRPGVRDHVVDLEAPRSTRSGKVLGVKPH